MPTINAVMANVDANPAVKKTEELPRGPFGNLTMQERRESGSRTTNELVTFVIGEGDQIQKFRAHKSCVCEHSPALKAAFNGTIVEGTTQTYHFPKYVDAGAFYLLIHWLYTQRLDILDADSFTKHQKYTVGLEHDELRQESGDTRHGSGVIMGFGRTLVDSPSSTYDHGHAGGYARGPRRLLGASSNWFHYAYEHSSPGSPLRLFAIDQALYHYMEFTENPENFPHEMLLELANTVRFSIHHYEDKDGRLGYEWDGYHSKYLVPESEWQVSN